MSARSSASLLARTAMSETNVGIGEEAVDHVEEPVVPHEGVVVVARGSPKAFFTGTPSVLARIEYCAALPPQAWYARLSVSRRVSPLLSTASRPRCRAARVARGRWAGSDRARASARPRRPRASSSVASRMLHVGRVDGELDQLVLERQQRRVGQGVAQAHVGGLAVARQHVHVRERGLELLGDDAPAPRRCRWAPRRARRCPGRTGTGPDPGRRPW